MYFYKYPTKMEVVMTSLRLTIRLKTSDESERLVIDLIEGNFASDPSEVSFTELQRQISKCVKENGSITVRWLEYVETPMNPYADGIWRIISSDSQ